MTRELRRKRILEELRKDPHRSDREIGRRLGVDGKTVGKFRTLLIAQVPAADAGQREASSARMRVAEQSAPARSYPYTCPTCGGHKIWQECWPPQRWHCYNCRPPRHWGEALNVIEYAR